MSTTIEMMSLPALLEGWGRKEGGEWSWQDEFNWLWLSHWDELESLMTSIEQQGILEPILLGSDGLVWDGHSRLAVADELGLSYVPVRYSNGLEEM